MLHHQLAAMLPPPRNLPQAFAQVNAMELVVGSHGASQLPLTVRSRGTAVLAKRAQMR
jgi:hypothetical protein